MRRPPRRALLASLAALALVGGCLLVLAAADRTESAAASRTAGASPTVRPEEVTLAPVAAAPRAIETVRASTPRGSARVALGSGPTSRLRVRVKFARRSVVGAQVRVLHGGAEPDAPAVDTTDALGWTELEVPAGRGVTVEVEDPSDGVVVRRRVVTPAPGGSRAHVFDLGRIHGARSLTFEVVAIPSGGPLRALVSARSRSPRRLLRRGNADAAGYITLPWQEDGVEYTAEARGYCAWSRTITERPEGQPVIRIELLEHARVSGIVARPRRQGRSAEERETSISLRREGVLPFLDPYARSTAPDETGAWSVTVTDFAPTGEALTGVSIVAAAGRRSRVLAADLTVCPGDRIEVTDPFEGAPGFELVVLGRGGRRWPRPLALSFVPHGAPDDEAWLTTTVEGGGHLTIDRLPLGRWDVYAGGWIEREVPVPLATLEHDGTEERTLDLSFHVPLFGRVLRSDGTPMKSAELVLRTGTETRQTWANVDGTFDLSAVEAGTRCAIEVSHPIGDLTVERFEEQSAIDPDGTLVRVQEGFRLDVEIVATGEAVTIRP